MALLDLVCNALLGVFDLLVGGMNMPEALLSNLVAGIEVGVVDLGSPTVGRPDLLVVRVTRNTKHLIGRLHCSYLKRIADAWRPSEA
jgi:hypothetical protein